MATYVNDLRLKEIATGDESGTWGTSTNTNLELIADAFSYATKDCFASDADATETMADGVADEIRSLYLKVTSSATLTATRTLTLAPNTVSKTWIIENATTGGQSISISQGSGANVTIPNGDTKIIYTDGAGAGAAVTDAFANLNVGDLTATNIAGTLTTAAQPNITSLGTLTVLTGGTGDLNWDSGTLFVDSSANSVGIGTTSPNSDTTLTISAASNQIDLISTDNSQASINFVNSGGISRQGFIKYVHDGDFSGNMQFRVAGSEAARIDSSGNVGIGTSSPSDFAANANNLVVGSGSGTEGITINSGTANYGVIYFADSTSGSAAYAGNINYNHADNSMRLGTNGSTTDVVIDASGNVGIGTSSPGAALDITASGAQIHVYDSSTYVSGTSGGELLLQGLDSLSNARTHATIAGFSTGSNVGGLKFSVNNLGQQEVMRLDSSGNVGIGVVPSDWSSSSTALQIGSLALEDYTVTGANATSIFNNAFRNSSDNIVYIESDFASSYGQYNGEHNFNVAPSGTAGATLSFTNAMKITSSANVGIGTTSPDEKLHVFKGSAGSIDSAGNSVLTIENSTDNILQFLNPSSTIAQVRFGDEANNGIGSISYYHSTDAMTFSTAGSERMRILDNGSVAIGSTSNLGVLGVVQTGASSTTFALHNDSGNRKWFYLPNAYYGYQGVEEIHANGGVNRYFANASGTAVGSIVVNSGSTAFNTTSDYRLKDNPQPLTGSGEFIDSLQPKTWTWNHGDGGTGVGFIAHEAAEVGLGLCVSGEKDATRIDKVLNEETGEYKEQEVPKYQQVDYSNSELIANMVAELQSLRARIADLES